jgi:LuxR family maltose regulon positive regulatory protein
MSGGIPHKALPTRMWLGKAQIGPMLEISLVHPHTIVSMLANDLADLDNEVFLFLDDYHLVTDPAIRRAVSFLLRHAPSHLHWSLQRDWSHRYRLAD